MEIVSSDSLHLHCNPYFLFPNVLGCFAFLLLVIAWTNLGFSRLRLVRYLRQRNAGIVHPSHSLNALPSVSHAYPKISIVMAVKGIHHASVSNWETSLSAHYDGEHEFIFSVEDHHDPAYPVLSKMAQDKRFSKPVKVIVAGLSSHCSQKLHNLLQAVKSASKDSKYILVLDDDIAIHVDTINTLVNALEGDPKSFCACGYSLDLPPKDASIAAYCAFIYRCGAMIGFSRSYSQFVWGGCLLLRKGDLDQNTYSLIDMWRDGGYSDDMILSILCRQEDRLIATPLNCIFPNVLDPSMRFASYLNFVRRQGFAILMYASDYHRIANISLAFVNFGTLAMNSIPVALAAVQIANYLYVETTTLAPAATQDYFSQCELNVSLSAAIMIFYALAILAMRFSVSVLHEMCFLLSPSTTQALDVDWLKVWFCYIIHTFSALAVNLWNLVSSQIVWAGIRYTVKGGRVVKVERDFQQKPVSDTSGEAARIESLRNALASDAAANFPISYKPPPKLDSQV
eukprot:TRINITY_DN4635_c0_g2_i5.p1 TRINITY_DN4635_c0_g2~~TRINITY_DN4635_c0_g2_i5.p1  ORF type:complete len:512 (+),score=97.18 TRINITY_DN4635_c0_g2_i5:43-1578(+)